MRYVDDGKYNGGRFPSLHGQVQLRITNRANSVKIEVIQAGPAEGRPAFPPDSALERTTVTGLKHIDGAISMARDGPDTATGDFFICIGAQPELDFAGRRNADGQGFAAFGKVLSGMDVVKKIQQAPADGQKLKPPVTIRKVERLP